MNPKQIISTWITQIEEFKESLTQAERAYKRTCGGSIDSDDKTEYDNERYGCAAAIDILGNLDIPEDISRGELVKIAVKELKANGPKNPQRNNVLSFGITSAIAVIEGNPGSCYNFYHPRNKERQ
ncbi:hypothetical protein ACFL6Y_10800 [Elusimicrobiota bacterium]